MNEDNRVEITLRDVYDATKKLDSKFDDHIVAVEKEFGRRPSRAEMYSFIGFVSTIYGVALALVVL